jgi:hypothetical protein
VDEVKCHIQAPNTAKEVNHAAIMLHKWFDVIISAHAIKITPAIIH